MDSCTLTLSATTSGPDCCLRTDRSTSAGPRTAIIAAIMDCWSATTQPHCNQTGCGTPARTLVLAVFGKQEVALPVINKGTSTSPQETPCLMLITVDVIMEIALSNSPLRAMD